MQSCLGPAWEDSNLIGSEGILVIEMFKSSPGNYNVEERLQTTGLGGEGIPAPTQKSGNSN